MSPIPEKMSTNLVCRFEVFCNSVATLLGNCSVRDVFA